MAPDQMLSKDPILEGALKGLQHKLSAGGLSPIPAPREPIIFTVYRERVVVDESQPLFCRAYAWWKNVQSWVGSLRTASCLSPPLGRSVARDSDPHEDHWKG